jgi:hypothetical protein
MNNPSQLSQPAGALLFLGSLFETLHGARHRDEVIRHRRLQDQREPGGCILVWAEGDCRQAPTTLSKMVSEVEAVQAH